MSDARLSDRVEYGVAGGDILLLAVSVEDRLGAGLGAANGLLDLYPEGSERVKRVLTPRR